MAQRDLARRPITGEVSTRHVESSGLPNCNRRRNGGLALCLREGRDEKVGVREDRLGVRPFARSPVRVLLRGSAAGHEVGGGPRRPFGSVGALNVSPWPSTGGRDRADCRWGLGVGLPRQTSPATRACALAARASRTLVGIDVGGTKVAAAAISSIDGTVVREAVRPTPADPSSLLRVLKELSSEMGASPPLGVALPTPVTPAFRFQRASNLPALNVFPGRDELSAALGVPVVVGNDAKCAALAEARLGAGSAFHSVLFATVGTGIGSAHVIGGHVLLGSGGASGEMGHIKIADGPRCTCGRDGCLEELASGRALDREARSMNMTRGRDLVEAAEAGDEESRSRLRTWAIRLAEGIGSVVLITDPELVVLGGGVFHRAGLALDYVRKAMADQVPGPRTGWPEVRLARYGALSAAVGAALMADAGTSER